MSFDQEAPRRRLKPAAEFRPLEVVVDGGDVEWAMKVLRNKMNKEGILKTLKRKKYYEKPSEAAKRKSREAARRKRKTSRY